MAANALEVIKKAEAEAKQIRQSAIDEAQAILNNADREGLALVEEAKRDAARHRSMTIGIAEERAQAILQEAESDAKVKTAVLTTNAGQNAPKAEALIIERIRALWQ